MRVLTAILLLIALATGSCRTADGQDLLDNEVVPLVDHHQHLLSPAGAALQNAYSLRERLPYDLEQPVVGEHLVAMLDRAGIKRAVVLSDAYWFDSPPRARTLRDIEVHDVYAAVRAENDWTAREVARFPDRLLGFCSFNPLKEYVLQELDRCAENRTFKGLKLHFAASAVDLKNKHHVERVRRIFEAANAHRLAIIVHVRGDRSYGREHAEIFLTQLLPAAPDIPVQIAHLWGGDGFSEGALTALIVYADAVSAEHRATTNLYFDVTQLALILRGRKEPLQRMATLIRQIGVGRILYGSDGPIFGNVQPSEAWGAFRREMPLTGEEFTTIANNIAPYVR
jgi:predicted TIM-barrel fold metal-dependent hydrolase